MTEPNDAKQALPAGHPISSLKKVFAKLSWALIGLRFAFISPEELKEQRHDGDAPGLPQLVLASVAGFLILVNVLGHSGAYDNLELIGNLVEEPVITDEPQIDPDSPEEQGFHPTDAPSVIPAVNHIESDDSEVLTGVPAKLWSEAKRFLFVAYLLLAFPGIMILLAVVGISLMAPEAKDQSAKRTLSEDIEYVWYQTLNLLVITALLAAGIALVWQFADAIFRLLGLGIERLIGWIPFISDLQTVPEIIIQLGFQIDPISFVPGYTMLFSLFAVSASVSALAWHRFGPGLKWLAPLGAGAWITLYAAPLYVFRFLPYLTWVWLLVLWLLAAVGALAFFPVHIYLGLVLAFKWIVETLRKRKGNRRVDA